MTASRSQRGFTLIEVVTAFAILALAATAIYESFGLTLGRTQRAADRQAAILIAQSLLDRAGVDIPVTPTMREEGQDGTYRWVLTAKAADLSGETDAAPYTVPAFQVEARVGGISLRKLILQPQP